MPLLLRYVAHSEIGLIRKNNQDSGYASPHLLVVADGMGGAAAGDLASAVAIETIRHVDDDTTGERMLEVLGRAVTAANDRIADLVEAEPALDGMGTTLTGALFDGAELGLAHIGDSRAYRMRDGRLERLTHDHSWVQSLVDEGKISEAEAANHPHRSLLLKVLNGQPANDPDLARVPVEAGDRLMFCSDGVCGLVDDDEIAEALRRPTMEAALERLVSEALAEGGIDNITVIVADVVGEDGTATGAGRPVVLGAAGERPIPELNGARPTAGAANQGGDQPPPPTVAPEPDDEARYSPRAPGRRRWVRSLAALVALVLVAGAGLGAAYAWTRTQFFVGADGEQVAIYQGLADAAPLARVYEVQPLALSALPRYYADQVRSNIEVANLDAARAAVAALTDAANRCATQPPTPTPRPTPARSPVPSPAPGSSPATPVAVSPTPNATLTPTGPEC